ncbi:Uncharacterised protein [Vibrio cholerae]|nr:Uncharacterised protein [Vibrio cholerae]
MVVSRQFCGYVRHSHAVRFSPILDCLTDERRIGFL